MKPVSLATVKGELFRSLPELEKRLLWQCEETTVQANKELLVTLLAQPCCECSGGGYNREKHPDLEPGQQGKSAHRCH